MRFTYALEVVVQYPVHAFHIRFHDPVISSHQLRSLLCTTFPRNLLGPEGKVAQFDTKFLSIVPLSITRLPQFHGILVIDGTVRVLLELGLLRQRLVRVRVGRRFVLVLVVLVFDCLDAIFSELR